jgi:hypothetical protein
MTTLDLDALEALCNAATPGAWVRSSLGFQVLTRNAERSVCELNATESVGSQIATADFIAASRAALPALIAEVRRLRAGLKRIVDYNYDEYEQWATKQRSKDNDVSEFDWLVSIADNTLHDLQD